MKELKKGDRVIVNRKDPTIIKNFFIKILKDSENQLVLDNFESILKNDELYRTVEIVQNRTQNYILVDGYYYNCQTGYIMGVRYQSHLEPVLDEEMDV